MKILIMNSRMMVHFYIYLSILLIYLFISVPYSVINAFERGIKTDVKAEIPAKSYLRIYGYTAPSSIVQAIAARVFGQTNSDGIGYFLFEDLPISSEAREICISSIDSERRVSFPLCIALPETDKPREIGPLLLSPTLSLSTATIVQNDKAYATGRTVPNENVTISFSEDTAGKSGQIKIASLLHTIFNINAFAKDVPVFMTKSDKTGQFSFNLPTAHASTYRLFAKASYRGSPTPKSHSITFFIAGIISYLIRSLFPLFLLLFFFLILFSSLTYYEIKTRKGRVYLAVFIETRWKPFVARGHLALRRLKYNLLDWWSSHQR